METIIASAIAVLGTLLGSGITLAFQQRTADRSHQMLSADETLGQAAEVILADVTALSKAASRSELDERRVQTRDGISALVRAAKGHL
ncbi:hypothetical protein ABZ922_23880 [Streptomyces shenzhenensis]|uniref:hypothetical protein n=1 Tax=Streptomyces shenzhenensis TaxID=943815 RepID=UPI0033E3E17B